MRQYADLNLDRIPDKSTILNFRRLLEKHVLAGGTLQAINGYLDDRGLMLNQGTVVDARIIHASSSTKNKMANETPKCTKPRKGISIFWYESAHRRRRRIGLGA